MAEDKGKRDKSPRDFQLYGIILVITAITICIIGGLEQQFSYLKIEKILVGSVIVTILFTTVVEHVCEKKVLQLKEKDTKEKRKCYKRYAFLFGIVLMISYIMILASVYVKFYSFWMLGGLILAVSLNTYIGIALHYYVFFLSCIFQGVNLEYFSIYFILGTSLCLLAPFLRQMSTMGYVVVIGLVGNGVAVILEQDFSIEKVVSLESLYSEISVFMVILLTVWISWVYQRYFTNGNFQFISSGIKSFFSDKEDDWQEKMIMSIEEFENYTQRNRKESDSLRKLANTNYPLIEQLKKTRPKVYQHSKQVAVLAEGAAERIGIDKQLVYIGGLYHEIGKLHSKDYITEGISIGKQYGFPMEVIALIEEHNVKHKIPATKEAAVLMLADSVIFLLEHIEKKGLQNEKSIKDMIESVFRIRLEKGELDRSGLSVRDFKMLEHYCVDYGLMINRKEEEDDISF